ncbi:MAG TPA: glycerol kinase GlpK [Cyclobacteriaceae bacterium]|nr:glycerol kinase GlpK [Cyclobacteriaceae bacterium]
MEKYILALDQGTTSSRAIVFDHKGTIQSVAQKEFKQHFPKPGWVEHDPDEIWATQAGVAAEAISKKGINGKYIAAIGITNQRESTIIWDRESGRPIHNAIVWQDRRTSSYCDELKKEGLSDLIKQKTGLFIDPYFSATKIKWLLDNVPGARQKAENGKLAFGTVDTWLTWRLTNGHTFVTDVTNASRTMLFNIHTLTWDAELLKIFNIPENILGEVRSSSEIYGETGTTLFASKLPIAGIAGDQQAALFGQACFEAGMIKNTYGTGCFIVANTGAKPASSKNLLTTVAWKIKNEVTYALEGSIFIGGALVQWLRDGLEFFNSSSEVEAWAKRVPDSGGVYLVPAFTGLGTPHWDSYARGLMIGITRGTTKAHICRAALDAITFDVREVTDFILSESGLPLKELRVDGGASANDMLMQLQADVLNKPVVRPKITETTALGAAYLAGLAVGYWNDMEDVKKHWLMDKTFEPGPSKERQQLFFRNWKRAVERSKNWIGDIEEE